jgi:hypothetical protein
MSIVTKTLLTMIRLRGSYAEDVSISIKRTGTHGWTSKIMNLISKKMMALVTIYLVFERYLEN